MKKLKQLKLKPSARDKRRYLLVNEPSEEKIKKGILEYIGILGFAKSLFMKVKTKKFPSKSVISCSRKELKNVHSSLVLSKIKVEKIANTIKGLEEK